MDIVYESFLKTFSRENLEIENKDISFHDFFGGSSDVLKPLGNSRISVTKLTDGKTFVSNFKSKGFFIEESTNVGNILGITSEYKTLKKSVGKITDLFGFKNRCLANIVEIFSDDKDSEGLGCFTDEFLARSKNTRKISNIDIDKIFTIAYEANGNRIVLTENGSVYIYAHDLDASQYEKIENVPKNTFYAIPGAKTLNDFVMMFFADFLAA